MEVPKTEGLPEGRLETGSSGEATLGNGIGSFSCPLNREAVSGAGTFRQSWHIRPDHLLTVLRTILTSGKPAVTLCACRAPEPSTGVKCCVLDAGGKVITVLPETCAGTANPKRNENGSCTCGTSENMIGLPPHENDTSSIILKK